jgi:hypothetical protein
MGIKAHDQNKIAHLLCLLSRPRRYAKGHID